MKYYGNSLVRALARVYPEHDWSAWKFNKAPMSFWKEFDNRKAFFDWAGKTLKLESLEGWYAVTAAKIHELGTQLAGFAIFSTS
jgi:hypothetical protein